MSGAQLPIFLYITLTIPTKVPVHSYLQKMSLFIPSLHFSFPSTTTIVITPISIHACRYDLFKPNI